MPLLITDKNTFTIDIRYSEDANNKLTFYEKDVAVPEGVTLQTASFTLKKPSWADVKIMMLRSMTIVGDQTNFNPYIFMDTRMKALMRSWTLKDTDGNDVKVNGESIDSLHPSICTYLHNKIDEVIGAASGLIG